MHVVRSSLRNGVVNGVLQGVAMEGEHLDTMERMVVSPAAGIFRMVQDLVATIVTAGTTIGFVDAGGEAVPVRSPFAGHLVALDAVDGERLTRHQRVAWLRCA
jgi:hypothetical protein